MNLCLLRGSLGSGYQGVVHSLYSTVGELTLTPAVPGPEHQPVEHAVPRGPLLDNLPGDRVLDVHRHADVMGTLLALAPNAATLLGSGCGVMPHSSPQ